MGRSRSTNESADFVREPPVCLSFVLHGKILVVQQSVEKTELLIYLDFQSFDCDKHEPLTRASPFNEFHLTAP